MSLKRRFHSFALLVAAWHLAVAAAAQPAAVPHPPNRPVNRLAKETSPYLLLHAHNPVDWHPWGPEALAKAKLEKKLIFLSVGYSSCYWCHVMERESFMDEEIAAFLNKHFVCIKVDREERPDIDEIYMTALRIYYQVTGSGRGGGWPLSMFLTPEAKPVAGGTYFPPRDKERLDGFLPVLARVQAAWEKDPKAVQGAGEDLAGYVKQTLRRRSLAGAKLPDAKLLEDVQDALAEQFDAAHGGFGFSELNPRQPKFPEPTNLLFLIDRVDRLQDTAAKKMLTATLEKMAAGGIRDHLGGGFHRYSTDRHWRIPHFEKMLYDNGQLATVYAEAHRLTGREDFKRTVEELLAFVARELTSPEGGFYSALDAETDGKEGRYYVWDKSEIAQALPAEDFNLLAEVFGLGGQPNFEEQFALVVATTPAEVARKRRMSSEELATRLDAAKSKLLAVRAKRKRPLTDTKILASWNGLMIRGYADAGRLFARPEYVAAAGKGAEFALAKLRTKDGRLLRTYGAGQAKLNAYLDDYAFLCDGLIALHQATGDARWLQEADGLAAAQIKWFWDDEFGGFFFTSSDHEELLARSKDPIDNATPAANSVSVSNLVYLAQALRKPEYLELAEKTVLDAAAVFERSPGSMPRMAVAIAQLADAKKALPDKASAPKSDDVKRP